MNEAERHDSDPTTGRHYSVPLSEADMVDIRLPDGRIVAVSAQGHVTVFKQDPDSWVSEGWARLWLPVPEMSASDHQGFHWDVIRTRKRGMSPQEAAAPRDRWQPVPRRKVNS